MRTERFRGPAIAGGFGALVVLAVACMGKPDYPPYVESGSTGGNVSGGGGATTTTPVTTALAGHPGNADASITRDVGARRADGASNRCVATDALSARHELPMAGRRLPVRLPAMHEASGVLMCHPFVHCCR